MKNLNSVATVAVRELSHEHKKIIDNVESGQPYIVTRNGKPVAALFPIAEDWLEDLIVASMRETVEALNEPSDGISAGEVFKDLSQ